MQNSPGIPLAALVVAIALATVTILSVIAGIGGGTALNELQIGATAWALALGLFGLQGVVSIIVGSDPARSSVDAEFFIRWTDRVIVAAKANPGWTTAAERDSVLEQFAQARAEFLRRDSNQ